MSKPNPKSTERDTLILQMPIIGFKSELSTVDRGSTHVAPLKRKRNKQGYKCYQRPVTGDRVQMDTIKIDKGIFQYMAIDDCSRFLVVAVYDQRTAANTVTGG